MKDNNYSIEKIKKVCVLCTIDTEGRTAYLRSLHDPGKWEITTDIETATKYTTDDAAMMSYDFYQREMGSDAGTFVIVPLEIEYRLIEEQD